MAKHMPPYAPEFRAEAIRFARTSGKPHAEIARELGMTGETLRLWLKQADGDEGKRSDGLTTEEQEELRRLRRENRMLREEREILKKVAMSRGDIPSDENGFAALRERNGAPTPGARVWQGTLRVAMLRWMGGGAVVDRGTGAICP